MFKKFLQTSAVTLSLGMMVISITSLSTPALGLDDDLHVEWTLGPGIKSIKAVGVAAVNPDRVPSGNVVWGIAEPGAGSNTVMISPHQYDPRVRALSSSSISTVLKTHGISSLDVSMAPSVERSTKTTIAKGTVTIADSMQNWIDAGLGNTTFKDFLAKSKIMCHIELTSASVEGSYLLTCEGTFTRP